MLQRGRTANAIEIINSGDYGDGVAHTRTRTYNYILKVTNHLLFSVLQKRMCLVEIYAVSRSRPTNFSTILIVIATPYDIRRTRE